MSPSWQRPKRPESRIEAGPEEVRPAALVLLARREHAVAELTRKLIARGYDPAVIDEVLAQLADEGKLSEQRFIEEYVRVRAGKGYGPVRIRAELRKRGIDAALIDAWLDEDAPEWQTNLVEQRRKRFGAEMPQDYAECVKQMQFLQYRGYATEQIRRLFKDSDI